MSAFPLDVAVFMAGAPQRRLCPLFAVCSSFCAPDTVPVLAGLCVSAWRVVSMGLVRVVKGSVVIDVAGKGVVALCGHY